MLLKNGRMIINNCLVKKDILIKNNLINMIADEINCDDLEVIDLNNKLVIPGAIDVHVHFREPGYEYKETIKTGSMAAAKGGITTVMTMPNLNPFPDCKKNLEVELDRIKKSGIVNIYPYGTITKGEEDKEIADIDSFSSMVLAISDDGKGVNNLAILEEAMKKALKYDLIICSHAEDKKLGYLPSGEYVAVRREIELAKKIGCRYHFCHLSTKESLEEVRRAKQEGYTNISCEVSPHHLVLNEKRIKNANFKMNPPLRSEEDRQAVIKALIDGTANIIASDHAPHSEEEKSREYCNCPNGIIGLETELPIIYTEFVKNGIISFDRFKEVFVYEPIRLFHLPKRDLKEGFVADIAVLDIDNYHIYQKKEILSIGKNSPFEGEKFYGFNVLTLVNGKIVYKKENL